MGGESREQTLAKGRKLIAGKHAQERLQHDGGFAQASVQIIMEDFETLPLVRKGYTTPVDDDPRDVSRFVSQGVEGLSDRGELAEEACPGPQNYYVGQI